MTRVLVVSSDTVGERMAGPGIRAWELSRALSAAHEVTLAAAAPLPPAPAGVRVVRASRGSLAAEAPHHDVAVVQGSALDLLPASDGGGPALVIDLYDPFLLEGLELHVGLPEGERLAGLGQDLAGLHRQIAAGDFFLCASERQRLYWLGVLSALGRVNPLTFDDDRSLQRLLAVVPFGVAQETPTRTGPALRGVVAGIGEDDQVVLWGGGVWNWLDPLTLIRATAKLAEDLPRLRVVFLGTAHPNPAVPRMAMVGRAEELAAELELAGRHVFFQRGWVPYAERGAFLAEADAGVSLNPAGIEADLAFRTRVLDYLWAELPVVLTRGDATAELVERFGAGIAVPPDDVDEVAAALLAVLSDGEARRRFQAGSRRLADELRWPKVVAPLDRFCRDPRPSPDRGRPFLDGAAAGGGGLARKAWRVLRRDGVGALLARAGSYLRKRR